MIFRLAFSYSPSLANPKGVRHFLQSFGKHPPSKLGGIGMPLKGTRLRHGGFENAPTNDHASYASIYPSSYRKVLGSRVHLFRWMAKHSSLPLSHHPTLQNWCLRPTAVQCKRPIALFFCVSFPSSNAIPLFAPLSNHQPCPTRAS